MSQLAVKYEGMNAAELKEAYSQRCEELNHYISQVTEGTGSWNGRKVEMADETTVPDSREGLNQLNARISRIDDWEDN